MSAGVPSNVSAARCRRIRPPVVVYGECSVYRRPMRARHVPGTPVMNPANCGLTSAEGRLEVLPQRDSGRRSHGDDRFGAHRVEPGAPVEIPLTYGNSSLRFGITKFSPKRGVIVANEGNGWSHNAYTLTPGIPGDSGSGFMNEAGQGIGVLSTVELLPRAGSNNFGDLGKEIAYMHANSSFSNVNLVPGTEPFNPDWVNAILTS